MGIIVPYYNITDLDIGLSNVYISAGQALQLAQKTDSSYGCPTVSLTGTFSLWTSQSARMQDKSPVHTISMTSNVPVQAANPFPIYYTKMLQMFPSYSNVFP
jgi:hypothetical protein